jgi:HAD superfamily hydrolase (TIGR01509 family)
MLKAVIFDLDGTILINNEAYDVAFSTVLKKYRNDIQGNVNHTGGIGVKENWKNLKEKYELPEDILIDDLEKQTQEKYLQNMDLIKVREGFEELAKEVKESGLMTALATGNDKETTDKILEHFGLQKYFDVVTTIYEAGKPKPEPDIFLLAAERLGVEPVECVVIEDSEAGIESANNANMTVISIHEQGFVDLSAEMLKSVVN